MASDLDTLHLLSIALPSAPRALRAAVHLEPHDVGRWLAAAKERDVPLVIVRTPDSLDLYSTAACRRAAFRPLLESIAKAARNLPGYSQVQATEKSGEAALRHLLDQAAGLRSTQHGESYERCIAEAHAHAALARTLGTPLHEALDLAMNILYRTQTETDLASPSSTRASRFVEALGAERIVEEELVLLKLAVPADYQKARYATSAPPSVASLRPRDTAYPALEPGSSVRLRVGPFSLVPLARRRSG